MSIPSKRTIKKRLKELREVIEANDDPLICRMAQGMETAIMWATEDTHGWKTPADEAYCMADVLRDDLQTAARNLPAASTNE